MRRSSDFWRLFAPTAIMSLVLGALCTVGAVYLYRQQTLSAEVLGENIESRQAAGDLEETLHDMIALHRDQAARVEPLMQRVSKHLDVIADHADKEEEKRLSTAIKNVFDRYLEARSAGAAGGDARALQILESELLPKCQELRRFNARQVQLSEQEHRQTLSAMAWGVLGVGLVASLAGLLLGYGVMRGLRQSIHLLRVRVQDAADILSRDLPPVVWTDGGLDELHDRMQGVVAQIEQTVRTLQQREREVLRAEQLAAVGQLAAGMAHEIRNPLTSIKLLVQTVQADTSGRLPSDDLAIIEQEIRRMERTVQTFLDFARPPRLERSRRDLCELVMATLNLVRTRAARQGVTIDFQKQAERIESHVDGGQLQQVLLNLILNALDVMPTGGRLQVRLELAGQSPTITVRDTGPGIMPALLPRLFEPFASSKQTGLGLGLVVSKRIVEDHGGSLRGGNQPEGGAAFEVRLPPAHVAA
jgi:two-component system, NtrC family, sensor histidine kinase HydH